MRGIVRGMKRIVLPVCLALAAAACAAGPPEPGPLGVVEVGPGGFIEVRSVSNLGGESPGASYRAAALAIDDYGPIKGRAVALVGMHDPCEPGGGQASSQTIAADARVVGVIGTQCSVTAVEAIPAISEAGMVMISPTNTAPALTSDLQGNRGSRQLPGYYRTAHNDLITGRVVAEFAYRELGLRRMAAIHDGDPYTIGSGDGLRGGVPRPRRRGRGRERRQQGRRRCRRRRGRRRRGRSRRDLLPPLHRGGRGRRAGDRGDRQSGRRDVDLGRRHARGGVPPAARVGGASTSRRPTSISAATPTPLPTRAPINCSPPTSRSTGNRPRRATGPTPTTRPRSC